MTTYTKEQIEAGTLSAQELLLSWTSGQGSTGLTPKAWEHVKTGAVRNVPVSIALLTALVEMFAKRTKAPDSFFEAVAKGYLSDNHLQEYKEVKAKTKSLEGHVRTAEEYLTGCLAELPELPTFTPEAVLTILDTYSASMNKTELVSLITAIKEVCIVRVYTVEDIPTDKQDVYYTILNKEKRLSQAMAELGLYLDDVKEVKNRDNAIQGRLYTSRNIGAEFNKLLIQEGYNIELTTPVPAKFDANFNQTEEGFILFTIKLPE